MINNIDIWRVLGAAVASFVVGGLWYSPILFGRKWMALMGFTKEHMDEAKKKGMAKTYAAGFVLDVITAYVFASFLATIGSGGIGNALGVGFWLWLGFMAPLVGGSVLWEGKSWQLFYLNASYRLVSVLVMGLVLSF